MIKLFSDSSCDMPRELIEKYDIGIIPFGISYGGETFVKDFYELTPSEFFSVCRTQDATPKTSQPIYTHYEEKLRPALEAGHDALCLCITSKFSGSYQSGVMAMNNLREEFPDRKIVVMDSRRCTVLQGYLMYQVCLMREDGMGFDEIVREIEAIRDESYVFVTVDSLEFLRKGGRLGKAGALAGSILNIKPIITFTDAELQAHSKVRGKKNALAEVLKAAVGKAQSLGGLDGFVAMALSCDMPEESAGLAMDLKNAGFGPAVHEWTIGPVVGTHLGPTGYGVLINKKYAGQKIF